MITDNKLKPKHRGAHSELTAAAWSLDHGYEVSRNVGKSLADAFIRADEASDWWDGYCERTDFDKSPASVEINGTKDFSIGVITSTGIGDGGYAVEARYEETPSWGILVAEIRIRFLPHHQFEVLC